MNLSELLSYTEISQLGRIANHYECNIQTNSKNELIQHILAKINKQDLFEKNVETLSIEDRRFLNALIFEPKQTYSLEELLAKASMIQHMTSPEDKQQFNARSFITNFMKSGWLFTGHSAQTKYLYRLPTDLKLKFSNVLETIFKKKLEITKSPPEVYRDEHVLIVDDLIQFLQFISENQVPLSPEGAMYKRSLQQILTRFSVRELEVTKTAWRFGYGRHFREYPNRFSLIYDYSFSHQLITEQNQAIQITDLGLNWSYAEKTDVLKDIFLYWLRLYRTPIFNIRSLVYWILTLSSGQWVTIQSITNILDEYVKPYYYDAPESIIEQRLVQMLMHLGLIRVSEDPLGQKIIRTTNTGIDFVKTFLTIELHKK